MRATGITLLAATFTLIGCGDPSTLTREEAERFWRETGQGASNLTTNPNALTKTNYSVSYTSDCLFGGNISVEGTATADFESMTANLGSMTANVSANYNSCAATEDYTVNGNLNLSMDMSATEDSSSIELQMNGVLNISGEIEGTCALDVTMSTTIGSDNSVTVSYSGTICGFEAQALVETSSAES